MNQSQPIKLSLLAALLVASGGTAQAEAPRTLADYGQLMTVRVDHVPANTDSVTFDLGPNLQGLKLHRGAGNTWSGSYAVLPEMANPIFRPEVHLYDSANKSLKVAQTGTRIQMASSDFEKQDLATVLGDKRTVFAFDDSIAPESIKLRVADRATSLSPRLGNQTFTLPTDITPDEIRSISARTVAGDSYVYSPETGFDAASVDESF